MDKAARHETDRSSTRRAKVVKNNYN